MDDSKHFTSSAPAGPSVQSTELAIPVTPLAIGWQTALGRPPKIDTTERLPRGAKPGVVSVPINAIAKKTLRDKLPRVYRDTIVRAITKMIAVKALGAAGKAAGGKNSGQEVGWLFETVAGITMQATEESDKRAWTTLPARIDVGRLWLTPGTHTLKLQFTDRPDVTIPNVKIEAGKRVFVTYRTIP